LVIEPQSRRHRSRQLSNPDRKRVGRVFDGHPLNIAFVETRLAQERYEIGEDAFIRPRRASSVKLQRAALPLAFDRPKMIVRKQDATE
jgi:hypothetical protein